MALVKICSTTDVPEGQARRFEVGERLIAICNLGGEGWRAIDAVCSHEHYFLDEGEVDVDLCTIECPKHGSTFDLNTGKPRTLPAVASVSVYEVTTENSDVLIEV